MNFTTLYRQHRNRLERFVARVLGREHERAADLAQDAFLRIYAAELGEQTQLSEALLYTAAKRLALNELRNVARRATDSTDRWDDLDSSDDRGDPQRILEARQSLQAMEAVVHGLPDRCREVLLMRKVEGLSHAEIAEQLGIAVKTVERHLTRALAACRQQLPARDLAVDERPLGKQP